MQFANVTSLWGTPPPKKTASDACTASLTGGTLTSAADSYTPLASEYADTWAGITAAELTGPVGYPTELPALTEDGDFCALSDELKKLRS